jgi:hypothetical protein
MKVLDSKILFWKVAMVILNGKFVDSIVLKNKTKNKIG